MPRLREVPRSKVHPFGEVMYGLLFGDVHLSAHSSLYLLRISDPTAVMLTLGMTGKFHFSDDVGLYFDPQFGFALNDRDTNKDMLFHALLMLIAVMRKYHNGSYGSVVGVVDLNQLKLADVIS